MRRRGVNILDDAPTDAELSQARFCHLLALPGMLVLGVFNIAATQLFGWWGLLPLNLALPSIYRILTVTPHSYGTTAQKCSTSNCSGPSQ